MSYRAPVRDQMFVLREVLELDRYSNLPGFADASLDTVEQILTESARFCEEVLAPINKVGDTEGCHWSPDYTVTTPKGFKDAYRAMVEAGWPALGAASEFGGQALPRVVNLAYSEMSSSANMAFSMYPGLTHGAYSAILEGGSPEQKATYLPKLASGQWGGTMNLTEPQCGTDLGLLRTKAAPQADGSYRITGEKSGFPAASTTWRKISSTWCWPASRARRPGCAASRCSSRPSSCPPPTAASDRAMRASSASAWKRRWASTATPPASCPMRTRRAG